MENLFTMILLPFYQNTVQMKFAFEQGGHFILCQIYGCFTLLGRGGRKKIDFSKSRDSVK